ncbi:hypothetical protein [Asanoa iriomotensis]|uniref:hypothetical protein n=1 Tax=Asanoa iriomotensis TaxID=234613 RepID=UPI001944727E|nr:hypothetical protein [Asanoa iriomotensis]
MSGRPFYARALRLKHINPSSTVCFVFLEGATAFAVILALAELIPFWGVVLLPICIAAMVKVNDVVAGAAVRAAESRGGGGFVRRPLRPFRTVGRATVPGGAGSDKIGRVYRSAPPEASSPTAAPGPDSQIDLDEDGDDTTGVHRGAIPVARQGNPAAVVNSPPADLNQGRTARTPTARASDVFDTPAQRARHSATRRYE